MGQFCIELNVDIMGLLLALVIAVALLLTCVKQPPRRAIVVQPRIGNKKPLHILLEMGKVICSELHEGDGLDLTRLLMALVIALTLMAICIPPPPRRAIVVARRIA